LKKLIETEEQPKRAFLISLKGTNTDEAFSAGELASLAETLGFQIAARETAAVKNLKPRYLLGTGKAAELAKKAGETGADCIVFDRDISPSQQRNWEDLAGIPVVDRQELIIQIFASRAQTREAVVQVELARLAWSLPRLQHRYIDLSRQRGGSYGTRGAGETKLETDRRKVEQEIRGLRRQLEDIRRQRNIQQKQRTRQGIPLCAIVGYTNAGKSSLLNKFTGASVFVENTLFATLDTTTRRFENGGRPFLLSDTVGFIRNLPHSLIDAFHSTLEEVSRADILIHVLDVSDPEADVCYETTCRVLQELGAEKIPVILALNKTDLLGADELEAVCSRRPGSIPISVKESLGLDKLLAAINAKI
jgi:GTP-binding protein HflX